MTRLCKTHKKARECPDCLAELRYENKKLKERLDRIYRAALISNQDNPVNRQWLIDNASKLL